MNGAQFEKKIEGVLARVNATSRVVKLRQLTFSGGNNLLGLGQTKRWTDTVVSPPPAIQPIIRPTSPQASTENVSVSDELYQLGDYIFTFAGSSFTEDTLKSSIILYGDEELHIVQYTPNTFDGVVVAWSVILRSMKAAS